MHVLDTWYLMTESDVFVYSQAVRVYCWFYAMLS